MENNFGMENGVFDQRGGISSTINININNDTCSCSKAPLIYSSTTLNDHHFGLFHSSENSLADDHGGGGGGESDEGKVASASKNHSQAEKRRRDRINAHLATLRKLISLSDKMDKAAVLGKVVEHVKELKRNTMELSKVLTIPTDIDQVIINSTNHRESSSSMINASVCCDDRPELLSELNQALKALKLGIIGANITCLGGRIKCNFVISLEDRTNIDGNGMNSIKQTLGVVFGRIVSSSSSMVSSSYRIKSKRQRFFNPDYQHHQ